MNSKICNFFELFGYRVNNKCGNENLLLNSFDLVAFFGYLGLSIYNLISGDPTGIGFAINFLTLLRYFFKNLIEQSRKTKSKKNYANFTLIHMVKIVMEFCIIVLIAILYIVFHDIDATYQPIFMSFYIGIVLFVTSFENLLAFMERIYNAEPKVLQYAE